MRRPAIVITLFMGLVAGWPSGGPAQSPGLAALSVIGEGIESLANGVRTLVEAWGRGLEVRDARQCRTQKQNLGAIAASLNLLVVDKTVLVDRLDRFAAEPSAEEWSAVQEAARLIEGDLEHLTGRMRQLADHFAAPRELSAAYRDILSSLEARKSLLMQGIEELRLVDRPPSTAERTRLAETADALRTEVGILEGGIAAMGEAIDRPCPEFG